MFLVSFTEYSNIFPNIFIIIVQPITYVPVFYMTLVCIRSISLGNMDMFLNFLVPLKYVGRSYLLLKPCVFIYFQLNTV